MKTSSSGFFFAWRFLIADSIFLFVISLFRISISFFKKYLFIYLFIFMAAPGLICGIWDLRCGMRELSLWRMGSLLWCAGFSSCGAQFFYSLVVAHGRQSRWAL